MTVTSTADQATDLGYLLHKHPDKAQRFELSVGVAHVFYPQVDDDRCTVALLLEVDPVGLVRSRRGEPATSAQYVNDRPYAASSMLAVALGKVFGTALKGRCKERPDLVDALLPLTVRVPAVPCRPGPDLVRDLFAPLGWDVAVAVADLDPQHPAWGASPYLDLTLTGTMRLQDALSHLYVLLPVLDGSKHYWVGTDEIDKLVRGGGAWLATHPQRDLIARRYLAHQRDYVSDAVERLTELDDQPTTSTIIDAAADPDAASVTSGDVDAAPVPLARTRADAVVAALTQVGATRVVDLGCGQGALLARLLAEPRFTHIVGVDVSARALDVAASRLRLDRLPDTQRARLTLRQSSATYRDRDLAGYDAVVLMEVVEHVDPDRLPALQRSVFEHAAPRAVVVTTPNAEYNSLYPHLAAGTMRHADHRFEWTRAEFTQWAESVAAQYEYDVSLRPVGDVDAVHGPPTQLALFTRPDGRPA